MTGKGFRQKKEKCRKEIITIDGPAGAGKSTVSKMLARHLHYLYLDTGAMYRAVALKVRQEGVNPEDEAALEDLCQNIKIIFQGDDEGKRIILDGEDVTRKIREPAIGWMASRVSMKRSVREAMVRLQRKIGEKGKIVAEGRDTGTVVFPDARYKFFLSAEPGERARRRRLELVGTGLSLKIEEIEKEMARRDEQDSSRELAPLRRATDALLIDSTGLTPEEVVARMLQVVRKEDGQL
ncbi:MAG: (d)CMP kinase [Thermodesulfobacteriota bacterium]|nr:(d)CMP kinase [Thermodesulfobacteriota bacterium]